MIVNEESSAVQFNSRSTPFVLGPSCFRPFHRSLTHGDRVFLERRFRASRLTRGRGSSLGGIRHPTSSGPRFLAGAERDLLFGASEW
jgi:hypothetical protein